MSISAQHARLQFKKMASMNILKEKKTQAVGETSNLLSFSLGSRFKMGRWFAFFYL
jgi:hypothetical protein